MRRVDQHRLARLRQRKLGPIPTPDPTGTYLGTEFITFDQLHETCQQIMDPSNSREVEQYLGKMDYRLDPTYNLKRRV